MSLRAVLLAFWVVWGAWLGGARADDTLQAIPALQAHVTDTIGLLPEARRAALETRLADLEARKGAQVAVLVVASTQPEDIAAYSIRVVEAWKLGRAKVDDGVLFLIARDDRRLRIEVGRGLEGAIPDAVAKRIIAETVAPRFKAADFPGGIEAGVEALTQLIDGETLPESEPVAQLVHASALSYDGLKEATLMALIHRYSGTPYIWGGDSSAGTDCSGLASWLANTATGRPIFGDRFDTSTEESELLERGFRYGTAPGALVIGWNDHHTAITLADGTPVASGEGSGIHIGGGGAYQPQFNHHMYLPITPGPVDGQPAAFEPPADGINS